MTSGNRELGQWGERQARLHLESKGYEIVATNFRCRAGEIDIVASHQGEMVFVEVKTRRGNSFGQASEAVSEARGERLAAVAEEFMQSRLSESYHSGMSWRIDLVCLDLDRQGRLTSVTHIPHAIEL